jgi:hypothetical protein
VAHEEAAAVDDIAVEHDVPGVVTETATAEFWPNVPEGGFHRVLLKLSGEAFAGEGSLGVDPDIATSAAPSSPSMGWTAAAPTTWACWAR